MGDGGKYKFCNMFFIYWVWGSDGSEAVQSGRNIATFRRNALLTLSGQNCKISEQVAITGTQAEHFTDALNYQTTELSIRGH
jgi:hypothetical protein